MPSKSAASRGVNSGDLSVVFMGEEIFRTRSANSSTLLFRTVVSRNQPRPPSRAHHPRFHTDRYGNATESIYDSVHFGQALQQNQRSKRIVAQLSRKSGDAEGWESQSVAGLCSLKHGQYPLRKNFDQYKSRQIQPMSINDIRRLRQTYTASRIGA